MPATVTLEGRAPIGLTVADTSYADCIPSVTLRGRGGAGGPYAFALEGGAFAADSVFVVTGPQRVIVRDADGCVADAVTVDVPAPEPPAVDAAVTYVGCASVAGTVRLSAGGEEGVGYVWADGYVGAERDGLRPGRYDLTATGATGCAAAVTVVIEDVEPLSLALGGVSAAKDCTQPDGTATVEPSGGVSPLRYAWSHDAMLDGPTATGLAAGDYTVAVEDARGCTDTLTVVVPGEPGVRLEVVDVTDVLCAGLDGGRVELSATDADGAPVTVAWADGVAGLIREGLPGGTYVAVAVNDRGCTDTVRVEVADDRLRIAAAAVTPAGCDSTGAVALEIAGGVGPYVTTWADGLGGPSRLGLTAGTYALAVTDAAACVVDTAIVVGGDAVVDLGAEALTLCPAEARRYGTALTTAGTEWYDGTGLLLAVDSAVVLDAAGAYTYLVPESGVCGGRGTVNVTQSTEALFAQFLVASAAVVGQDVVAIETSVPMPDEVGWRVSGPGPVDSLGANRNEHRWRFGTVGEYALTLEATRGACVTTVTKTVTVVADSASLPQAVPVFGELVDFRVSPNPTAGPFTAEVRFTAPRAISVRVYDLAGALVREEVAAASATHSVAVDISDQVGGQYFVVVTAGTGSWVRPLVRT